ncbi:MAG: hypothetical protein AB1758_15010 [Candidatus Eremiobacterota bacterium]
MRRFLWLLVLLALAPPARAEELSPRMRRLVAGLPGPGQLVETVKLGFRMLVAARSPGYHPEEFVFAIPPDLDRHSTDETPFRGRFPELHLNVPLEVVPGSVNYLFVSDQPEKMTDERKRVSPREGGADPGPGATGLYARSPLPGAAPIRALMDHTNATARPLVMWLVWVPQADGAVSVRKRGECADANSVKAGGVAFVEMSRTRFEPRAVLQAGASHPLVRMPLTPGQTGVVHLEFTSTVPGELFAVVTEPRESPPALAELEETPVLHSIVWQEEEERLGQFIDPEKQPTRYQRIRQAFQHARGHFQFPERVGRAEYRAGSWDERRNPLVQAYSLFESIPGVDVTVQGGATTDNRGRYGARIGFELRLAELPPGCREVALLVANRSGPYGGRHWVSNGRVANEVIFAPGLAPGMLGNKQVATLWRGPAREGDTLKIWSEPMANGSVQLWYLVVPIP